LLPTRLALTIVLAVLLVGATIIVVLGSQVRDELQTLRNASSDNVEWNLSQLEVDLLNLQLALDSAMHTPPELAVARIRQKFDIFYSRNQTFTQGATFSLIRENETMVNRLANLSMFLEESIPLIDGPDEELLARAFELGRETEVLHEEVRGLAIFGVSAFARITTDQRELLSLLLSRTSSLLVGVIIVLGIVLGILVHQFGITERESQSRRETNMWLNAVIRTSLDAVVVVDSDGLIVEYNGAAQEIFGFTREELLGRSVAQAIVPERFRASHRMGLARYTLTGEKHVIDSGLMQLSALHKDGHEIPVEMSIASADGPNGTIFVSFIRDITERQRAEEELTAARDDALAAYKAKSNFLAVMSHEMRTPLNGIMGTLELLAATDLQKKQKIYVDIAQTSGGFLMRHINDVLDISKVQADKLELTEDTFSPFDLASEVADVNRANANARGNAINVRSELPETMTVISDRFRVSQTLFNLVGNAIKFTYAGTVEIVVSQVTTPAGPMVEFRVNDTGIGISEENMANVFDDFVTIDNTYSRRFEGTGLGLGISKRMAEAMGGSIGLESEMGAGSSFWFRTPLILGAPVETEIEAVLKEPETIEDATPSMSILLVEDNVINSYVAREMLESLGHKVTEAQNGQIGVDLAAETCFDLILMDISMPVLDGVNATVKIRTSDSISRDVPIVGLTAHALPEEMARFRAVGMQDCMVKPVSMASLTKTLREYSGDACSEVEELAELISAHAEAQMDVVVDTDAYGELLEMMGDTRFSSSISKFIAEAEEVLVRVAGQIEEPEIQEVQQEIHKLAGASATFGAKRLQARLSMIETACKRGDLEQVNEQTRDLPNIWRETREELAFLMG